MKLTLARFGGGCSILECLGFEEGRCYAVEELEDGGLRAFGNPFHAGDDAECPRVCESTPCMECELWEVGRPYRRRRAALHERAQALHWKDGGGLRAAFLSNVGDSAFPRGFLLREMQFDGPEAFHEMWEEDDG